MFWQRMELVDDNWVLIGRFLMEPLELVFEDETLLPNPASSLLACSRFFVQTSYRLGDILDKCIPESRSGPWTTQRRRLVLYLRVAAHNTWCSKWSCLDKQLKLLESMRTDFDCWSGSPRSPQARRRSGA